MNRRLLPALLLIAYSAILIKVMVFKNVPVIRVGHLWPVLEGPDIACREPTRSHDEHVGS